MKTKLLFSVLFSFFFYLSSSQVPQGFNYQAVAKEGANPITTAIDVRLTIQSTEAGGTTYWIEKHAAVQPNSSGMFTIVAGAGVKQTGSTLNAFSEIDWTVTPKYLKTEISTGGSFVTMGTSQLLSVPFSMVAGNIGGSVKKLTVSGQSTDLSEPLFEVKNKDNQTVFAVYSEGVRVFVDDGLTAKGGKGGFAIGGFGTEKAVSQPYLIVSKDNTRVNVSTAAKGSKGGFAIGGFDGLKGTTDFFNITKDNYFIGQSSGLKTTTGTYNSFLGFEAGRENTTGSSNIFLGYSAGLSNLTGESNVFLGYNSGYSNLYGTDNVFIGNSAGKLNVGETATVKGSYNVFLGTSSGFSNTTGYMNVFIGYNAGGGNTTGAWNTFIGRYAGLQNSTGNSNLFLGNYAGTANKASNNIFIGDMSGGGNTSGTENIFLGVQTGEKNILGSSNTYIGYYSSANIEGSNNISFGSLAGANQTSGDNNVYLGSGSRQYVSTAASNNVMIGRAAGQSAPGSGNIFIGYNAGTDEPNSNRLYIENSGAGYTSALIYGEFDTDLLKLNATVKIRDLLNLVPRASAPSVPAEGDVYYDSVAKKIKVYNGTTWKTLAFEL